MNDGDDIVLLVYLRGGPSLLLPRSLYSRSHYHTWQEFIDCGPATFYVACLPNMCRQKRSSRRGVECVRRRCARPKCVGRRGVVLWPTWRHARVVIVLATRFV
ncbi:unnamed protein product, partial [Heterosigma akashiwo]